MSVDAAVHREVALLLGRCGQRYTAQRRQVVEALGGAGRPLTMPEILEGNAQLSQSTAYRTLAALAEAGAVRRLSGSGDYGRFELAEDLSGHHHHLICEVCGRLSDITPSPRLERALREAIAAAAGDSFRVSDHRFELVGTCADCRTALPES
jgi:Fur family ferric uptake transcriptional regulator